MNDCVGQEMPRIKRDDNVKDTDLIAKAGFVERGKIDAAERFASAKSIIYCVDKRFRYDPSSETYGIQRDVILIFE